VERGRERCPETRRLRVVSTSAPQAQPGTNRVRITFVAADRGTRRAPATRASFALRGAPFIVGGHAFAGTRQGVLHAIDLATGGSSWSIDLKAPFDPYLDFPQDYPLTGITAGEGLLLVPADGIAALEPVPA